MGNEEGKGLVGLRIPKSVYIKYGPYITALKQMSELVQAEGTLSDLNYLTEVSAMYLSLPRPALTEAYEIEQAMADKGKPQ